MSKQYEVIANRWLNGGKELNNTRLYYRDDILYSYGKHYIMARKVPTIAKDIILINNKKNSATTNKQKSIVIDEIRSSNIGEYYFYVPSPGESIEVNIELLWVELDRAIDTAKNHMIKANLLALQESQHQYNRLNMFAGRTDGARINMECRALFEKYNSSHRVFEKIWERR